MEAVQNLLSTRRGAILVGAAAAVLAAILLVVYLNRYRDNLNSSTAATSVLVAKNLIPKGASGDVVGSGGQVAVGQVPRDKLENTALVDPAALRGRVAAHEIFPGQQITAADFVLASAANQLQNRLEGVQRGVGVQLDGVRGLPSDVQSGDHVDVWVELGNTNASSGNADCGTLRLVLPNTVVLRAPGVASGTVVLRANERDAARLAYAYDHGTLWFFLRPATGARYSAPANINCSTLLTGPHPGGK